MQHTIHLMCINFERFEFKCIRVIFSPSHDSPIRFTVAGRTTYDNVFMYIDVDGGRRLICICFLSSCMLRLLARVPRVLTGHPAL